MPTSPPTSAPCRPTRRRGAYPLRSAAARAAARRSPSRSAGVAAEHADHRQVRQRPVAQLALGAVVEGVVDPAEQAGDPPQRAGRAQGALPPVGLAERVGPVGALGPGEHRAHAGRPGGRGWSGCGRAATRARPGRRPRARRPPPARSSTARPSPPCSAAGAGRRTCRRGAAPPRRRPRPAAPGRPTTGRARAAAGDGGRPSRADEGREQPVDPAEHVDDHGIADRGSHDGCHAQPGRRSTRAG